MRIPDSGFRITLLVLAAIAALSFSYNQIAQARSVRYHPITSNFNLVVDTWSGRLCAVTADCWPMVNDTLIHTQSEPVHIRGGGASDDSTR